MTRNKKTPQREEIQRPRLKKDRLFSIWEQKDIFYLSTLPMLMPTRSPTVRQKGKIRKLAIKSQCVSQIDVMSAYNGCLSIKIWLDVWDLHPMIDKGCLNRRKGTAFLSLLLF